MPLDNHLLLHYPCMRQTTHVVCVIVVGYGKHKRAPKGVLVQVQVLPAVN